MTFARRLKFAREAASLSQKALANLLGVAQTAVSSWERGRTEPSRAMTAKIAEALRCGVYQLDALEDFIRQGTREDWKLETLLTNLKKAQALVSTSPRS